MKHKVIGIDLGTTYSAVAAYDDYTEQAEILPDTQSGATVPSVVGLDNKTNRVIVGTTAKQNLPNDPRNTVIEIKREMGELFSPKTLDKYSANDTYAVGDPVKARFAGQWLLPQEISAFILMKMKGIAEVAFGEEIRDAVITVPAYFHATQKKATEEAALLAGLYPRQLIPEPTAAAICYGVDRMDSQRRVYMVYDLGGGTFDVSIIEVQEDNINVIATSGDPRLGGGDFDDEITKWAVAELLNKHHIDISNDPIGKARIKHTAESAKISLSSRTEVEIPLLWLRSERPPILVLTRKQFDEMINPYIVKSLTFVEKALIMALEKGILRKQLSAILLVGGSTLIPLVRTRLLDYFEKSTEFVRNDLDPAAVVARGAAILAQRFQPSPPPFHVLSHNQNTSITKGEMATGLITEHSLGVGIQDNSFQKIISQGTNIPVSVRDTGYTNGGYSPIIEVPVYQGEGKYVYDNTLIGTVQIPVEPKERGYHQFETEFALDSSGLLKVVVYHMNNAGKEYQAVFEHKTLTKSLDMLVTMREKLLPLYQATDITDIAVKQLENELSVEYTPPIPPSVENDNMVSDVRPLPDQTSTSDITAAPTTLPDVPVATQPIVVTPTNPVPIEQNVIDATVTSPIVELIQDVQGDVKSLIRRAKKQLLQKQDKALLTALNALIIGVNGKLSEDEITDLSDDLEDVYHDARNRSTN